MTSSSSKCGFCWKEFPVKLLRYIKVGDEWKYACLPCRKEHKK